MAGRGQETSDTAPRRGAEGARVLLIEAPYYAAIATELIAGAVEQLPLPCQIRGAAFHTGVQAVADGVDPAHDVVDAFREVRLGFPDEVSGNLQEVVFY